MYVHIGRKFSPCTEEHVAVHLIIEVEYANAYTILDEYAISLCPLNLLTYTSISNLSVNHSRAKNQSRLVQVMLVFVRSSGEQHSHSNSEFRILGLGKSSSTLARYHKRLNALRIKDKRHLSNRPEYHKTRWSSFYYSISLNLFSLSC